MAAIYKKEFRGFMTSMVGYVFIAFLLVVSGIYYTAYHLQGAYPKFSYTLQSVLFVFLIAVPVLSMRVLAEERKQKTDQLLLTSPVSVAGIVMGKYLALVSVFGIAAAVLAVYPLILTQFGTISMAESYTALFGFFLMGSCYLSIGLYLSSVTESQVIAAVLTFLFLFVCYVIEGIASFFPETSSASFYTMVVLVLAAACVIYYMVHQAVITIAIAVCLEAALVVLYLVNASFYESLIQELLGVLDITEHFTEFCSGILDVTGIIYYLTVIGVFLFLTVQSIQKRRWS
ncbi:MAG: ABC transporter permease subunit [Lachnospiraceae bacterium]|nr:ABC transporter permease subunit [Lachnospiraceae bacterium]